MKLIYCYIENFRGINNLKLNLSSTHNVKIDFLKDMKINLRISQQEKSVILPKFISDISLLIGKNGTGKTRILDLISINRKSVDDEDERKSSYFMIYHLQEDTYYFEGNSEALLKKINFSGDFETSIKYDDIYLSCYFKYTKNKKILLTNQLNKSPKTSILYLRNTFYSTTLDYEQPSDILVSRKMVNINRIGYYQKYSLIRYVKKREGNSKKIFNNIDNVYFSIQDKLGFTKVFKELKQIVELLQNPVIVKRIGIKYTYLTGYVLKILILYITRASNENNRNNLIKNKVNNLNLNLSGEEILKSLLRLFKELFLELDVGKKLSLSSNFIEEFNSYISNLDSLNEGYFTMRGIVIPMSTENAQFTSFLKWLDKLNDNFIDDFKLNISTGHLSAGEETFLNLLTSIYSTKTKKEDYRANTIILLDEPDSFMHPEWCRRLINELFHFIEELSLQHRLSYQIILSTHSPFLSSDLPNRNVIPLDYQNGNILVQKHGVETFANNIHKLLIDKFFLKSTIGEFSSEIINNNIIKKLTSGDKLEDMEIQEIQKTIELIGEPILRKKLFEMLVSSLTQDPIEQEIKIQEKKLEELRKQKDDINK